jgi:hypothetical protein
MATGTRNAGVHVMESLSPNRVNTDFENFIDYDDRTKWPMAAYLSKKENTVTKDTEEFVLFTGELIPRTVTLNTTITTTDTASAPLVSSTNGIVAKTLLHVPNGDGSTGGDLLRVTGVTDGTSITVTRLTTAHTIADNATAVIIGNFDAENSTSGPAAFDMEPASVTGRMTILKRRIDITTTEKNSKVRGATDRLSEKLERAKMDFMLDMEHNAWFSRSVEDTTNRMRFSMGIYPQIANDASSIETDAGNNALVDADIGDTVAQAARWVTNNEWVAFHGQQAMAGIWELGQAALQTTAVDTQYGFKATNIQAPGGLSIKTVYARVFDIIGDPYASCMVGLDMPQVKNAILAGGGAKLERNITADESGETKSHQWRYQGGPYISTPKRHWIIRDITNF